MTTPIPYDDLRPDLWVTIREAASLSEPRPFAPDAEMIWQLHRHHHARPPAAPGTPLKVIEVDLPFLYVGVLDRDGELGGPLTIDLRRFAVVGLSARVAEAIAMFGSERTERGYARRRQEVEARAIWRAEGELARRRTLGLPLDEDALAPPRSRPRRPRRRRGGRPRRRPFGDGSA